MCLHRDHHPTARYTHHRPLTETVGKVEKETPKEASCQRQYTIISYDVYIWPLLCIRRLMPELSCTFSEYFLGLNFVRFVLRISKMQLNYVTMFPHFYILWPNLFGTVRCYIE